MAYHGVTALSVAVIDDGQVVWARAYGVRGRADSTPITTATPFQVASVSKTASAFGAMLLVQQGRLGLDDDIRPRLKSWDPGQALTLRQLLSHTAATSVSGFSGYAVGTPLPSLAQILKGEPPANSEPVRVVGKPGAEMRYSGGGYLVAQQLIEDVTGESFTQYMQKAVIGPLGMSSSFFDQPPQPVRASAVALGHRRDGQPLAGGWMVQPELAPAGLWSTPTDLARLVIELQDALAGRPTRVMQTAEAREMLTARIDNAGLGVFLAGPNGPSRRFIHTGRNAGYDAQIVGYKNGRQGAVVLINRNNNEGLVDEVLESIAREYQWPDFVPATPQAEYRVVSEAVQSSYAGTYEAEGRSSSVVVFEEGKLFVRTGDDVWTRLYPSSETAFFAARNATQWQFVNGEMVTRTGSTEVRRRRVR
jgi:CubicO group peptidase (beta-lactamase class C family)